MSVRSRAGQQHLRQHRLASAAMNSRARCFARPRGGLECLVRRALTKRRAHRLARPACDRRSQARGGMRGGFACTRVDVLERASPGLDGAIASPSSLSEREPIAPRTLRFSVAACASTRSCTARTTRAMQEAPRREKSATALGSYRQLKETARRGDGSGPLARMPSIGIDQCPRVVLQYAFHADERREESVARATASSRSSLRGAAPALRAVDSTRSAGCALATARTIVAVTRSTSSLY